MRVRLRRCDSLLGLCLTDFYCWTDLGLIAQNIVVRYSSFEHMAGAISILATVWGGGVVASPNPTRAKMAISAVHNVSIVNNDILTNQTARSGSTNFVSTTINLGAIQGLTFSGNRFVAVSGMRRDLPLVQLCNVWDAVISGNTISVVALTPGQVGGDDCGSEQEPYVPNSAMRAVPARAVVAVAGRYPRLRVIRSRERNGGSSPPNLVAGGAGEH